MANASTVEWAWTLGWVVALLFSSLYMWKLVVRGLYMWRHKENGLLRAFWSWQSVVTAYFVLSAVMFVWIGYGYMQTPAPATDTVRSQNEQTGVLILGWAFVTIGVQWFIWVMDRNTVERATVAEKAIAAAAETIAIVEANTQAVEENTAAVQENTEQTKGA